MGCSTSKNAVAAFERNGGNRTKSAANSIKEKNRDGSVESAIERGASGAKYRPSEAFVISLDGKNDVEQNENTENTDNLTRVKPPPKRLQRLMEQAQNKADSPSIANLEEKQAKAEQRRQEFLQQKIISVQKVMQASQWDRGESNDSEVLKSDEVKLSRINSLNAQAID